VVIEFEPTSLKVGEGLVDGWLGVVEGEISEGGGGGCGGQTKLNCDGVDLRLKLRSPT